MKKMNDKMKINIIHHDLLLKEEEEEEHSICIYSHLFLVFLSLSLFCSQIKIHLFGFFYWNFPDKISQNQMNRS